MTEIETRNDFTLGELEDAIHEGQSVETTYALNPEYDEQFAAYRAHQQEGQRLHLSGSNRDYSAYQEFLKDGPKYPDRYLTDDEGHLVVESVEIVDEPRGNEFYDEGGELPGIGHFKVVTYGNLGDGHEMWSVLQHKESGRTFIKFGYYSSWDSSDYDGEIAEVEPVEVTVTRYKNVKTGKVYADPTV